MAMQVHPRGTSWGSVLGGWLASLGALAIFFPIAALGAGMTPAAQARVDDPTLAFPLVLALFLAWLAGGYVAGRMAGTRRSWHGLMSAIWGLFVALVVALVAGGSASNFASAGASLPSLDMSSFGNATVFGFVLGIVAVILGGWLGGVLSPAPMAMETARPREAAVERPAAMRPVAVERHEPASADRPAPVSAGRRPAEPTFWDRLTGKDRAGGREVEPERARDEALVPPARPRGESGDGKVREEESEARR